MRYSVPAIIAECCTLWKPCAAIIAENVRLRRLHRASQRITDRVSDKTADAAADPCHCANANAKPGQSARARVFCCVLRHIEAALLLVGVALLYTLLCNRLRSDERFLRFGLRLNEIGLLAQLCLGNVGIFAEMQLLEFFILRIAVWACKICHEETHKLHAVIRKVGRKLLL